MDVIVERDAGIEGPASLRQKEFRETYEETCKLERQSIKEWDDKYQKSSYKRGCILRERSVRTAANVGIASIVNKVESESMEEEDEGEGSIRIFYYQKEAVEWDLEIFQGWGEYKASDDDSSEDEVRNEMYLNEYTMRGPINNINVQFNAIVNYFKRLNRGGLGRYDVHATILYDKRIKIDNNRALDEILAKGLVGKTR